MRCHGLSPGFGRFRWVAGAALALWLVAAGAHAEDPIAPFHGNYSGTAVAKDRDSRLFGVTRRDLDVTIAPETDGRFRITWTTVTPRPGGNTTRSTTDFVFRPAEGRRVWIAEAATDPMGKAGYVWAVVQGDALVVHVLSVDEQGRYNISTYRRERTRDGLRLEFRRQRDGEPVRIVTGTLARNR